MNKLLSTLILTTSLGMISTAFAATSENDKGFYVGTNLGYSQMDLGSFGSMYKNFGATNTTDGFAYNLHGGYMFNEYFGAELGYTKYADATINHPAFDMPIKYDESSFELLAKGVYHFNPQWLVFAKAGLARTTLDFSIYGLNSSITQTVPLIGIGTGYDVTPRLTLNVGWSDLLASGDVTNVTSLNNRNYASQNVAAVNVFYGGIDYRF